MKEFDYSQFGYRKWDNEIINLCSFLHEEKAKEHNYVIVKPKEMKTLVEIAKIQSTYASNKIEGIATTDLRLKQICEDKVVPKTHNEKEIAGYCKALKFIHENYKDLKISVNHILQLHKIMYSEDMAWFAGKFKNQNNIIAEFDEHGHKKIIFTPVSAVETPYVMDQLCTQFQIAESEGKVDPLILIPIFIHDFLCIHPFIDGNGRMSRLLTTLLLYHFGYYVGRYISLENKILITKSDYYRTLGLAQIGWHDNSDSPEPFIKYLLNTFAMAYNDLDERYAIVSGKAKSIEMVRRAVSNLLGQFNKSDVMNLCPSLSVSTVEGALRKLVAAGELARSGIGKSTKYHKK